MSADSLDALALQGDAMGAAPPEGAAPQPDAPPAESPNVGALSIAMTVFREAACAMLGVESPRVTLTDANIKSVAESCAPVLDKYGVNLMAIDAAAELQAAMVAGPILWVAAKQLNMELKAKKAKPVTPASADAASDGSAQA